MEHGPQWGHAGCFIGTWDTFWRSQKVRGGTRNPEEHQIHANTCGKQHRGPGENVVLGFGVVRAHFDTSDSCQRYDQHEDHDDGYGEHVVPTEVGAHPVHRAKDDGLGLSGQQPCPQDKTDNQYGRGDKDRFVDRRISWAVVFDEIRLFLLR